MLRDFPGDVVNDKVTYLCPQKESKSKFRHVKKVIKGIGYCSKYKIDVIVGVLNTPHGYIGRAISTITHIPYIHVSIAGHREFWLSGKMMERINLAIFRKAWMVTVTGQQTFSYLMSKGFDEQKVAILPNLPNQAFMNIDVPEENIRRYDIVSFSRIDKNKNVSLLLKAIFRIKDKCNVRLIVAGDGSELDNLKETVKELGLENHVEFVGYISDLEDKLRIYQDSRIFVSCSKGEGFPVSLLEAMSCGCVPVVSNVGDIVDVIKQGINGYVFNDVDDETELAECLIHLLCDEELMGKMSKEARKIQKNISVKNNAKIWDNILARIVRKG